MRLLLVGATDVRNSDATLLLGAALERAGCTVQVVPATTNLPLVASIGFSDGCSGDRGYRAGFNRHLHDVARQFEPDVLFLYGSNWCVTAETIERLRRRHGCQVILWEVNQWIFGEVGYRALPLYDHVFALDSYFIPVLRVAGARRVAHLGPCADLEEHSPAVLTPQDERRYAADVSFIGTRSNERADFLSCVAHTDLRVYGTGWEPAPPALDGCVRDEPVYGLKKNKVYSASLLSLNVHQPHMVNGENFRVFEVAACGGVSVSARKPDLVTFLEPGREVILFDSREELRRVVDHYLSRPDEREEIAVRGRMRVLRDHTYDHRARTILDVVD